jgi:hypothetical protein
MIMYCIFNFEIYNDIVLYSESQAGNTIIQNQLLQLTKQYQPYVIIYHKKLSGYLDLDKIYLSI